MEHRLVVEVDGGYHTNVKQAAYDRERTEWLQANGYRVLRFWNHEVLQEIDSVLERICVVTGVGALSPSPSPAVGRGEKASVSVR